MHCMNMFVALFFAVLSVASAVTPVPSPTTPHTVPTTDVPYLAGLFSSIGLLLALLAAIKAVGAIDYSNDILIITNAGDKKE